MFDTDLRIHETRFSNWPCMENALLLGSRLQLYSYILLANETTGGPTSPTHPSSVDRHTELLVQAYSTAIRLLQIAGSPDPGFSYWTSISQGYVIYAVIFLLKLLTYPLSGTFINEVAARNAISQSWELLHASSRVEGDHMSRVCAAIQYLSKEEWCRTEVRDGGPALRVRSRMAGNIFIDAMWCAKGRFSREVRERYPNDHTGAEFEAIRVAEAPAGHYSLPDFGALAADWDGLFRDLW